VLLRQDHPQVEGLRELKRSELRGPAGIYATASNGGEEEEALTLVASISKP